MCYLDSVDVPTVSLKTKKYESLALAKVIPKLNDHLKLVCDHRSESQFKQLRK